MAQLPLATQIAPSATTDIYPNTAEIPTSCYTFAAMPFGSFYFEPYISAWQDKVVWRLFAPTTTSVTAQGTITISGAQGIKVTMSYSSTSGQPVIDVVYGIGSSFYLAIYEWTGSSFTLAATPTLLTSNGLKMINIDCYGTGVIGIVWDEQATTSPFLPFLKCKFGTGTTFTGNFTLAGTSGQSLPDIALTRTPMPDPSYLNNNTIHAHIVSLSGTSPSALVLTEYALPVEDMLVTSAATPFTPLTEDVNNVGASAITPVPSIDCPDFDYNGHANWAYTYVKDGDICGRFSDFPSGTINTAVLTDGSMANVPISLNTGGDYANVTPTITYHKNGNSVFIGWIYSEYPTTATNYAVAVEVQHDGTSLLSPLDYLLMSSGSDSWAPIFSKSTGQSSFLYAVDRENSTDMTHFLHDWSTTTSFRPGATGVQTLADIRGTIVLYPNPVTDKVAVHMPAAMLQHTFDITVTDMTGKAIYSKTCKGDQVGNSLSGSLPGLAAGTYLVNFYDGVSNFQQQEKLVKAK